MHHITFYKCFLTFLSWKLVSGVHYYIDFVVYNESNHPSYRLFTCDPRGYIGQSEAWSKRISKIVSCWECPPDKQSKIHSITNFYMVNSLLMTDGRGIYYVNQETKPSTYVDFPSQVNLGLDYCVLDFPPLDNKPKETDHFTEQSISQMGKALAEIYTDVKQDDLLTFLRISNFGIFADSRYDSTALLKAYVQTLTNVVAAYDVSFYRIPPSKSFPKNIFRRKQGVFDRWLSTGNLLKAVSMARSKKKVVASYDTNFNRLPSSKSHFTQTPMTPTTQKQEQALQKLRKAIRILIHKMIDPCLIMSHSRVFALGTADERKEVDLWCGVYCRFLSVSTVVFDNSPSAECGDYLLSSGKCAWNMCTCERSLHRCGGAFVPFKGTVVMANCHNELRKFIPFPKPEKNE